MSFVYEQKVLFRHCDAAGIVFYPRYFEVMNDCVEAFFEAELDWPFVQLHTQGGVPTASISTEFKAPSRLGDVLDISLTVTRLGRSSIELVTRALCERELRFETQSTLVNVNKSGRPVSWPEAARRRLQKFMED